MFFQTYYDLISESRLPPASKFLDPYDLTAFTPKPGESLTNLIDRFQASREEKQLPQIIQAELKRLVVDSLYESTPTASRPEYFKEIKMPPNLSQMYTFTRATAKTLLNGRVIPASQRENRAKH